MRRRELYVLKASALVNSVTVNGTTTIVVTTGSSTGPETNLSLLATPSSAHPPANVTIDAFTNGVGAPFNLTICFGDGSSCALGPDRWNGTPPAVLIHQYNEIGAFAVEGTLTNGTGAIIESASVLINLTQGEPFEVTATQTASTGMAPLAVSFLAAISGGTPPYAVQWTFGDGSLGSSAPGVPVVHTYLATGTFSPWLLVLDSAGNARNVTIANIHVAPSATLAGLPGSVAGVPTSDWIITLAAATVIAGTAIAGPTGWRRRKREREKEGEELVRELEERR